MVYEPWVDVTMIVDIMNMVGRCVVAGNIRRSAEIAFGAHESKTFMGLKDYSNVKTNYRAEFGWSSNNSVFAKVGDNYYEAASHTALNGEPGYCWLENMQKWGRMTDPPNNKDYRAAGGNPCLGLLYMCFHYRFTNLVSEEQTLESYELCCLVEIFLPRIPTLAEFKEVAKYAYLYAKTVTLGSTHWPESNAVLLRYISTRRQKVSDFLFPGIVASDVPCLASLNFYPRIPRVERQTRHCGVSTNFNNGVSRGRFTT